MQVSAQLGVAAINHQQCDKWFDARADAGKRSGALKKICYVPTQWTDECTTSVYHVLKVVG